MRTLLATLLVLLPSACNAQYQGPPEGPPAETLTNFLNMALTHGEYIPNEYNPSAPNPELGDPVHHERLDKMAEFIDKARHWRTVFMVMGDIPGMKLYDDDGPLGGNHPTILPWFDELEPWEDGVQAFNDEIDEYETLLNTYIGAEQAIDDKKYIIEQEISVYYPAMGQPIFDVIFNIINPTGNISYDPADPSLYHLLQGHTDSDGDGIGDQGYRRALVDLPSLAEVEERLFGLLEIKTHISNPTSNPGWGWASEYP